MDHQKEPQGFMHTKVKFPGKIRLLRRLLFVILRLLVQPTETYRITLAVGHVQEQVSQSFWIEGRASRNGVVPISKI